MKPEQQKSNVAYEKLALDEFLLGEIEEIKYDQAHTFKGFQGAEDKVMPAVRFKFKIDGYQYPHYSRWMKFMYAEKSNLFAKFLVHLVEGAEPDMDFDIDDLKGMRVKTLWAEKGDFQNIETIRPEKKKCPKLKTISVDDDLKADEELPDGF